MKFAVSVAILACLAAVAVDAVPIDIPVVGNLPVVGGLSNSLPTNALPGLPGTDMLNALPVGGNSALATGQATGQGSKVVAGASSSATGASALTDATGGLGGMASGLSLANFMG